MTMPTQPDNHGRRVDMIEMKAKQAKQAEFSDHPDFAQLSAARRFLGGELFLKDGKLWLLGCRNTPTRPESVRNR